MIIYRSLNKSFQFIRSVPINDKNSQNDHYHYDYVMMLNFQENWDVRGEGGLKIRAHADKGGLKIRTHVTCGQGGWGKKWTNICGRPLWMAPKVSEKSKKYTITAII